MITGKNRRPRMACEFNAAYVVAARAADGGFVDASAVRLLPVGAITPSLTGTNIANRDRVRTAVQEAMAAVGGRTRDLIAVLPDAACRVVLLGFDVLPEKREEADAIVRFRLKKSLPFDVERARVSWQPQVANGKLTVLAVATLATVLEEYESLLRDAGFSPGVVLPSVLAALGQVDATVPTLVIKADLLTTSIAVVSNDALLLVRILDHPTGQQVEEIQLAEDVYSSLVFFHDTYGTKVQRILVSGLPALEELDASLAESTGIRAQELVSTARLGVATVRERGALGAVAGALV